VYFESLAVSYYCIAPIHNYDSTTEQGRRCDFSQRVVASLNKNLMGS